MSVVSNTLRKYAVLEEIDVMMRSVLREAADELDRRDGLIDAIKFDIYNYDHRTTPKMRNEVQV